MNLGTQSMLTRYLCAVVVQAVEEHRVNGGPVAEAALHYRHTTSFCDLQFKHWTL